MNIFDTPILPILILVIVFTFFFGLIMRNKFTLLKLYLTVISLVGVIGMAVGYGVAIYAGIQSAVITDEEYMTGRGVRYQLDVCSQPKYSAVAPNAQQTPQEPTEEEIQECEEEARANMVAERKFTTKQNVIGGLVWGTIALILFGIHYPMLLKTREED